MYSLVGLILACNNLLILGLDWHSPKDIVSVFIVVTTKPLVMKQQREF